MAGHDVADTAQLSYNGYCEPIWARVEDRHYTDGEFVIDSDQASILHRLETAQSLVSQCNATYVRLAGLDDFTRSHCE